MASLKNKFLTVGVGVSLAFSYVSGLQQACAVKEDDSDDESLDLQQVDGQKSEDCEAFSAAKRIIEKYMQKYSHHKVFKKVDLDFFESYSKNNHANEKKCFDLICLMNDINCGDYFTSSNIIYDGIRDKVIYPEMLKLENKKTYYGTGSPKASEDLRMEYARFVKEKGTEEEKAYYKYRADRETLAYSKKEADPDSYYYRSNHGYNEYRFKALQELNRKEKLTSAVKVGSVSELKTNKVGTEIKYKNEELANNKYTITVVPAPYEFDYNKWIRNIVFCTVLSGCIYGLHREIKKDQKKVSSVVTTSSTVNGDGSVSNNVNFAPQVLDSLYGSDKNEKPNDPNAEGYNGDVPADLR